MEAFIGSDTASSVIVLVTDQGVSGAASKRDGCSGISNTQTTHGVTHTMDER